MTRCGYSLTQVLQWCYWWNSTEVFPADVSGEQVLIELNTDFSTKGLSAQDIQAVVSAWQAGAISRDTMTDLFRRGEVLPEGRSVEEEERLISHSEGRIDKGNGGKAGSDLAANNVVVPTERA